jgi:hypothetical protein
MGANCYQCCLCGEVVESAEAPSGQALRCPKCGQQGLIPVGPQGADPSRSIQGLTRKRSAGARHPLWLWGLVLIVAGAGARAFQGPVRTDTEYGRGEAFGQGLVQIVAILAGVTLIVLHLVRGRRGAGKDGQAPKR